MLLQEAFQILELAEGAGRAQIRHAYARLSKIYHVETHPEEFARLHEAYKLALSAAEKPGSATGEEGEGTSGRFVSPAKEQVRSRLDLSGTDTGSNARSQLSGGKDTTNDILDRILGTNFSIENCSELTQLLCYRCRYDEISPEINAILSRITNAEQGITDDAHLQICAETIATLPNNTKFLGIAWGTWKTLGWTCIVCHPDFYRAQYTQDFLDELCHFLLEETLNLRNGIGQELYFALCMAYGFFSGQKEAAQGQDSRENLLLAEIEKLLRLHPKHKEYIKDLEIWPDCQEAQHIVLFCQEVYAKTIRAGWPASGTDSSNSYPSQLPQTAAELLLDDEIPWKEFIYDCLSNFFKPWLSGQFAKKRREFLRISQLRQNFSRDFIHLLDYNVEENYIYNACYLPLAARLDRIKNRYLTKKEWKKIICQPAFLQAFKNWFFPRHNGFSSVPCMMFYDEWKILRTCFEGSSPFEESSTRYLTTEHYFPEFEKRYKRERIWEDAHIEEAYFKETFPLPALSQGKLDFLETIKDAAPATLVEIEKIWGNLSYDAAGLDFLTRITNAMVHFNFLLVTGKHEKDAIPGDAFCFLEEEVLLYRKKENLLCHITHPVFYDLISWKFTSAAYPNGKMGYDEAFLNTACRNLYCYRCYAEQKRKGGE